MKMAYLSMDMFFGLYDNVQCSEARLIIEKMMATIDAMRECEADASGENEEYANGIGFAADCFQEALEDYLCAHSGHMNLLEGPGPLKEPSRN